MTQNARTTRLLQGARRTALLAAIACGTSSCPNAPSGDSTGPAGTGGPFYVYDAAGSALNHFFASGWQGDVELIAHDDASPVGVPVGDTCMEWAYSTVGATEGWAGVIWQDPEHNWDGDQPASGYDLDAAVSLCFRVRGAVGGEVVSFGFGGLKGSYPDSVGLKTKTMVLDREWQEVRVLVGGYDLSKLHNGFLWLVDGADVQGDGLVFYLDDVRYEFELSLDTAIHELPGICFSPFTDGSNPDQGDVATPAQVEQHIAAIAPYSKWIRTYGMAGALASAGALADDHGVDAAIGAWIDQDAPSNQAELQALIAAAVAGEVEIAVVGNEVLHRHDLPVGELVALIEEFRAAVPGVPVTTAEVYSHWIENPELVEACDVLFIHCYPFWEGVAIDQAVASLNAQFELVATVAQGKNIAVAETGWPSAGGVVGSAVPNLANANRYFVETQSWAQSLGVPVFYFSAFDEPFKTEEPQGVGPHWGLFDTELSLKSGMAHVFAGYSTMDEWFLGLPCGGGEPGIELTDVPPYNSHDNLFGQVCNVLPQHYAVAVYIYVNGWWTKPYFTSPLTFLQADGSFTADVTTGGNDHLATAIAAFLVPIDYAPPLASGASSLPQGVQDAALASTIVYR